MPLAIGGSSAPPKSPHGTLWVDVRDYGAKCDNGITDNSIPFQAAVDALAAKLAGLGGKGVVYIPSAPQSYGVLNSVWVDSDNIEIQGDGWGSSVTMLGPKQPVFIFGIPRVQQYVSNGTNVSLHADSTNRPDLYGKLDTSVVANPGVLWGIRTNGNSFVQFQASPLSAGAGSVLGQIYSDQWSETSKLTIEFCLEPPDLQTFPVNAFLLGCGAVPTQPSPFNIAVINPNTLSVFFRTSDIASDFEFTFRRFDFSVAGATAPYRIAIQFDLANAVCTAFVNGTQVGLINPTNLSPTSPIPFTPGVGLTFVTNDYYPFMIGTSGVQGSYGVPTGVDLRLYGLRLSNAIRYQNNGVGTKQTRADSPQTSLNDAWAYFGNDANTICWLWGHDNPTTAGRRVTVAHGGAVYNGYSTGLLIHSVAPLAYNTGNAIRNISTTLESAHGQTICIGAVFEFAIENVVAQGGYHGIGSFIMGSSYNIYLDHCKLDGTDAGYFGAIQLVMANELYFPSSGRATMRFVGSSATVNNVFVAGWAPVAECIFKASSYGYGGNFSITNMNVDFEGYSLSRAAIYCEAHPYTPGTTLALKDVYLGTVGQTTPLVMLKDMSRSGPAFNNAWLSIENLQAYTNTYLATIDVDGPLWHGEMTGVALYGPPFNHRQKWGTNTNIIIRDTKYVAPPRINSWYNGAHVMEVRSPADGQYTEWRCVGSGTYGTLNPPVWLGLSPLNISTNGLAAYVLNHYYFTASLS